MLSAVVTVCRKASDQTWSYRLSVPDSLGIRMFGIAIVI